VKEREGVLDEHGDDGGKSKEEGIGE